MFADIELDTFTLDPAKIEAHIAAERRRSWWCICSASPRGHGRDSRRGGAPWAARDRGLCAVPSRDLSRPSGRHARRCRHVQFLSNEKPRCLRRGRGDRLAPAGDSGQCAVAARARHGGALPARRGGFNYRMGGLSGRGPQCEAAASENVTERRRAIARRYRTEIRLPDLALPPVPEIGESVWHQLTVRHPRRDALREHLAASGVGTDTIYPIPLHLQPCCASLGHKPAASPQRKKLRAPSSACRSSPSSPMPRSST
ncbi:MAG: DegT/DnrJ/EryC1/StrS family aminotransferase [Marinilabiliales bacterium]|nr:DegT/DnrJ/EryC1/StrS family aminotransferase [Marinilabiliales bacterium]